jgi:DNA-binding LacI/PurR family transcriptional regulator
MDLISFDNLEASGLCPFGEPVLTGVTFPREKIAGTAVDLLLDQLENANGNLHTIRIPTELVIRKSTG